MALTLTEPIAIPVGHRLQRVDLAHGRTINAPPALDHARADELPPAKAGGF